MLMRMKRDEIAGKPIPNKQAEQTEIVELNANLINRQCLHGIGP
jgi:hypothetical protein